jgi:hypothetical protein
MMHSRVVACNVLSPLSSSLSGCQSLLGYCALHSALSASPVVIHIQDLANGALQRVLMVHVLGMGRGV